MRTNDLVEGCYTSPPSSLQLLQQLSQVVGLHGVCLYEGAKVSGQVASHASKWPDFRQSLHLVSFNLTSINPHGSSLEGMWVDIKALLMMSFGAVWCWFIPSLCLQLSVCLPSSSVSAEQCLHWYGEQTDVPSLRPTAMCTVLSSMWNSREDTGKTLNHAPDSLSDTESKLACSTTLTASLRRCWAVDAALMESHAF